MPAATAQPKPAGEHRDSGGEVIENGVRIKTTEGLAVIGEA